MATIPSWADEDWADAVAEPFRSDREFWSSLAASSDAVISLVAAVAVGVALRLIGGGPWALLPFVVPAVFVVRAARASSSRRRREAFADQAAWRDAERAAVAAAFMHVARRPRIGSRRARRA
jgi:hypothetical protein